MVSFIGCKRLCGLNDCGLLVLDVEDDVGVGILGLGNFVPTL